MRILLFFLFFLIFSACGKTENSRLFSPSDNVVDYLPPAGSLCTRNDPDFDEFRYREKIPHCRRNVSHSFKVEIAKSYGISEGELKKYEIDHYIPLNTGGSNARDNLWPLPIDVADKKAELELRISQKLTDGTMVQAQAIKLIRAWKP